MRQRWFAGMILTFAALATGCKKDNSADTDQAAARLRKAQSDVVANRDELTTNKEQIEQTERALVREQQDLTDRQNRLAGQRQELGSAQVALGEARAAYAAAVNQRLAKLDAALATLATETDAKARDAWVGLRARRDQLAVRLQTLATTPDPEWNAYTKDVDTTFDAIEGDLRDSHR